MPVSITKSKLAENLINSLVNKAFGKNALKIVELTEGFFNSAYKVMLENKEVVLKIAPPKEVAIMTHEKNIMFSEVSAMEKVAKETEVPVPEILFYDNSYTILDREYFFMEMLKGSSFSSLSDNMTEEQKDKIYYDTGRYTRMLNQIQGSRFGYYGQKEKQGDNWYVVFKSMISDTYSDAERKSIFMPVEKERVLSLLERDRGIFEEVKTPKFVHWDIWEGNVFVSENQITGIIDFERCLWADELMEFGFRTFRHHRAFFDGYGMTGLSREEEWRAKWYDIYLFLIWCLECDYRMYDNRETYEHGSDMLKKWIKML